MQQPENLQTTTAPVEDSVWQLNTGSNKIHAKRLAGPFRTFKWLTASLWLFIFLGPYLRWGDRQAVLFDIPGRQFHIFGLTIYPYDIWVLTFVLAFFAMLLVMLTVLAGRVFCGYFCFQTVWTDLFSWIEARLEGPPQTRIALDAAPWNLNKLGIKVSKHTLWLLISMLTGVSFAAWFTDAYQLWHDFFTLQAHTSAWIVLLMFTGGTYLFAGFMREQVCFWLCPYARIQAVLYDQDTLLPTYDEARGEPRTKLDRMAENQRVGCVDCDQCVVVCPTGIDIREGSQIGCITCGLCIDACDSVMDKIHQPHGLIRYGSMNEFCGDKLNRWYQRPQVLVSTAIVLLSVLATTYGLNSITEAELSIVPNRQPMFVVMSDGGIQNSYRLRVFNKSKTDNHYRIEVDGFPDISVKGNERPLLVNHGRMASISLFVKIPREQLLEEISPLTFRIVNTTHNSPAIEYRSLFIAPQHRRNQHD
ncbi:MAG: cytochrome c oxidase accessory protein CcoG [Candidatus Polarisedimenticolaceae bacterium]|nr:cytochrome c oxidase accessory protein CcoG [Candidatus Polarisedimenticolaceae bacterium]